MDNVLKNHLSLSLSLSLSLMHTLLEKKLIIIISIINWGKKNP